MAIEDDASDAAARAAYQEAQATDWPPDKADAERVGEAIGAAAAGAACTAYGAAAAAPICAAIGGAITGALVGAVWDAADGLLDNIGNIGELGHRSFVRVWAVGRDLGRDWTYLDAKRLTLSSCTRADLPYDAWALLWWQTHAAGGRFLDGGGFVIGGGVPTASETARRNEMLARAEGYRRVIETSCERVAIAQLVGEYAARGEEDDAPSVVPVVLGVGAAGLGLWLLSRFF